MRVAHGLVVKGYALPAFGGTSRRRSIMKNHQLSWWVPFAEKFIPWVRRGLAPSLDKCFPKIYNTGMKYTELTVHTTSEASELVADVMWQ